MESLAVLVVLFFIVAVLYAAAVMAINDQPRNPTFRRSVRMHTVDDRKHQHWCVDCATENPRKFNPERDCWCQTRKNYRDVKCYRHEDLGIDRSYSFRAPNTTTYKVSSGSEVSEQIRGELGNQE
jgi:hypothetical protein